MHHNQRYSNDKPAAKKWRHFLLLAIQFISLVCFSQPGEKKFTHLTTENGLSQSTVFSILKDYKGFMWFATDEGLNKYDGYKFTVYKHDPDNPASISNNSIHSLLEDGDHNLWVASVGGFDKFDRIKESFTHYTNGDNGASFKTIFQDSKKRMWLGTNKGFCLFDKGKGTFKFYKNNSGNTNSLSQNYVYKITEDDFGELWIGTRNGLNRFNPETEKFICYYNDPANSKSIGSSYIKSVYKDTKGNIWAGTMGGGAALFNRKDNSFINFKHDPLNNNSIIYNDILSFAEDSNGKLWIGTENGGISVFDYSKNTFTGYAYNESNPFSLSNNSVYSLYKDDVGNMWAGTWSGGVNLLSFSGDKFTHYTKITNNSNSLSNNLVLSICGDRDNTIWIGTDGGGLNRFDPRTQTFTNYRNAKSRTKSMYSDYVLSLSDYLPQVLALGFHRGGVDVFDMEKQMFTHYAPGAQNSNMLISPSINIVYTDRQHNLWAGTNDNGGIYLLNKSTKKFTGFFPEGKDDKSVGESKVGTMYETRAGELWIGEDKGLFLFDRVTKKFIQYQHDPKNKQSLSNNSVYSIMEDQEGNLWIGTADGLNFFNIKTKQFTIYTEKEGLPNNTIWSIEVDRHGNLWMGTNRGISKFNPLSRTFRNYTITDGLQGNAYKAGASYQLPDGQMFFGGVNGFNTFYPDSIKDNDFIPPVFITDFQIFNKPVPIGDNSPLKQSISEVTEITLSYHQSVFTIGFAALSFTQPERNMYAYKLEGFDKEWNLIGEKRSATYTNLDPGTYTFKVKGSNNDGAWNNTGASIKIIITPPFWRTWWFITVIALLIAGGSVAFYRFRMNALQKQKIVLEEKVTEQTTQLVQLNEETIHANQELEKKNIELEQFVYIASHDLKEPLRTTTSFVELLQKQYSGKLDEKADKYLTFITQASERMKTLINDLLDYSRIGSKKELQKIDCSTLLQEVLADLSKTIEEKEAGIECGTLPVISGFPTEMKQLFQNLIANAIKFRKPDITPRVIISAVSENSHWKFTVQDNGIGISKEHAERIFVIFQRLHTRSEYDGSGIGLAHCKKITGLHGGKIWVESTPGQGSAFHFTILNTYL